ncbi:MAG TPA: DUF3667 domain-containing protein [Vicinamibacterales bacterium]
MSGATPPPTTCYNCGTPLSGPFCSACGQKAGLLDPTVHDFLHDFTHEMFHVDGRIFRSVWKLLSVPGLLTHDYFRGRRARWVSPIRLYLIFSLLYFAASTLPASRPVVIEPNDDPEASAFLQRLGFDSPEALREWVGETIAHWGPRAMFVLVPVFAWLVNLAWRRRGRHYPQHLYFALHVHAAWFAVAALVVVLRLAVPTSVGAYLDDGLLLYGILYVVMAFRRAYGPTRRQAVLRMGAVLFAYSLVVAVIAAGLALALIFGEGSLAWLFGGLS